MEIIDVSKQPGGPIVKAKAVQEEKSCLTISDMAHWMRGG
jgi:hypothetical protein